MFSRLFSSFEHAPLTRRRAMVYRRGFALSTLVLLAETWRLWTPQTLYPQVPFFAWAGALSPLLDWLTFVSIVVLLCAVLIVPERWLSWKLALLLLIFPWTMSILLDQHRLQAWAYFALLVSCVLACADRDREFAPLRLIVVGVYFFSALSKFDYTFAHSVGQQFLGALAGLLGLSIEGLAPSVRVGLALVFPTIELLVAVMLCVPRVRRWGVALAVLMHLTLLGILGPWGLNHHGGVLVWNAWFIVQAVLLFGQPRFRWWLLPEAHVADVPPRERRLPVRLAWTVAIASVVLPLLEPWGYFDHWPAWALYAPRTSRVLVLLDRDVVSRLPPDVRQHIRDDDPRSLWVRLKIDAWSLASLKAPIYPQDRFQLGVAEAVARRYALQSEIRAVWLSAAQRTTGRRHREVLVGQTAIASAGKHFWLNTHPREAPQKNQ